MKVELQKINPIRICKQAVKKHYERVEMRRMNRIDKFDIADKKQELDALMKKLEDKYFPNGYTPSEESLRSQFNDYLYLFPEGQKEDLIKELGEYGKKRFEQYQRLGIVSGENYYRVTPFGRGQIKNEHDLIMLSR